MLLTRFLCQNLKTHQLWYENPSSLPLEKDPGRPPSDNKNVQYRHVDGPCALFFPLLSLEHFNGIWLWGISIRLFSYDIPVYVYSVCMVYSTFPVYLLRTISRDTRISFPGTVRGFCVECVSCYVSYIPSAIWKEYKYISKAICIFWIFWEQGQCPAIWWARLKSVDVFSLLYYIPSKHEMRIGLHRISQARNSENGEWIE